MSSLLARTVKRSAETASTFLSQVIVSVAAAICVGLITNAYFQDSPELPTPLRRPVVEAAAPAPSEPDVANLTSQTAAPTGIQYDGKAVWVPLPDALFLPDSKEPSRSAGARPPRPDPAVKAHLPAPARRLPPPAPSHGTEIFPDAVTVAPVEAWLQPAPVEEARRRLFGLPLPRLPRSPGDLANSVAAAKDKLLSIAPGLRRGEDFAASPD